MTRGSITGVVSLAVSTVAACSSDPAAVSPPPEPGPCPASVAAQVTCYTGRTLSGAGYAIGMPSN